MNMYFSDSSNDMEISSVEGWGRAKQFIQKLGKTPDSQSLSLSHCDLTATDVVELGETSDSALSHAAVVLCLFLVS